MAQHQYVSLAHNPAVAVVATEGHVDNPYNPFSRWGAPAVTWVEEQHEGFRAEYMDGKTLGDVCGGIGDPGQQLSCVSNARNVQAGSAALGAIVSTAQGLNSLATTGLDLELSRLPGDVGQQARRALVSDYRSARDGVDFLFNGNAHTGSRTGFGYRQNVEHPRLRPNPSVTRIVTIDPATQVERTVFRRLPVVGGGGR